MGLNGSSLDIQNKLANRRLYVLFFKKGYFGRHLVGLGFQFLPRLVPKSPQMMMHHKDTQSSHQPISSKAICEHDASLDVQRGNDQIYFCQQE
jgi:hypothetical protein